MTFTQPAYLLGLAVVAGLLGLYLLAQRARRKYAIRFTNIDLLASVFGPRPGFRRHLPPALFLLGVVALVIGLAGPILYLEVARTDASVVLVIDTSGSMAADDVAPTRMDAARNAATTLVKRLPANDRIGLVSFNTVPTVAVAVTADRNLVLAAIAALAPGGGTAIGDAVALAVRQLSNGAGPSIGSRPRNLVVVMTDGVSNRGIDTLAAAVQAKTAGVTVDSIGIGSRNPDVMVKGQPVGGVDEAGLNALAAATGGKYYFAQDSAQLSGIYGALGSEFGWRFAKVDLMIPALVVGTVMAAGAAAASLFWFRVLP